MNIGLSCISRYRVGLCAAALLRPGQASSPAGIPATEQLTRKPPVTLRAGRKDTLLLFFFQQEYIYTDLPPRNTSPPSMESIKAIFWKPDPAVQVPRSYLPLRHRNRTYTATGLTYQLCPNSFANVTSSSARTPASSTVT